MRRGGVDSPGKLKEGETLEEEMRRREGERRNCANGHRCSRLFRYVIRAGLFSVLKDLGIVSSMAPTLRVCFQFGVLLLLDII
jgi:hypothetical protein